jgi:hypothetical protein
VTCEIDRPRARAAEPAPEVLAVMGDLFEWHWLGVTILQVEPAADGGVQIGVRSAPRTAERLLRERYPLPVHCHVSPSAPR